MKTDTQLVSIRCALVTWQVRVQSRLGEARKVFTLSQFQLKCFANYIVKQKEIAHGECESYNY